MSHRYELPMDCAWVNYVRCHDDIGWSFADEDAAAVGIKGFDHRQFLNQFYTGRFAGSFASGLPFNYNPVNQDMRICGTAASLCGLELGINLNNATYIDHAMRRLLMIHSLILSAGGIPLIYIGDELAMLNDYSYTQDNGKSADSRWVHRPQFNWQRADLRHDLTTPEGQMYNGLKHLITIRKRTPAFGAGQTLFFDTYNPHVLGFIRNKQVLVLANFSEVSQQVSRSVIAAYWQAPEKVVDLVMGVKVDLGKDLQLAPYQFRWLTTM
jgi:amylosucrase